MGPPATIVFKLCHNISLEGDLSLAQMELESFIHGKLQPVGRIDSLQELIPDLARLKGLAAVGSFARSGDVQAFLCQAPIACLPELVRKLSFVQRIYCITEETEGVRFWLTCLDEEIKNVTVADAWARTLVVQSIPHYALYELASVVARRSRQVEECGHDLDAMLDALLDRGQDRRGVGLARKALAAHSTTSHLTHDLHYYKAKFFPRLARAALNVSMQALGSESGRILDPFVGSGTTLLEAATLACPAVGLDIDPLSVLISQTKVDLAKIDCQLLLAEAARMAAILERAPGEEPGEAWANADPPIIFPHWLLKNRAMTTERAQELAWEIGVMRRITAGCHTQLRSLSQVLMSDAISRRIRMRFLGTGVGRFSLTWSKSPATGILMRSWSRLARTRVMLAWLEQLVGLQLSGVQAIQGDARALPKEIGEFDILLTSPPYLPASSGRESYARARAPSLIALGIKNRFEIEELEGESVGSMEGGESALDALLEEERALVEWLREDPLRNIKAEPTARYFLDMRRALAEMLRVLRPGGVAVVISGKQSTFYNFATRRPLYVAHSARLLATEAERVGFQVQALHDIQLQKANLNARPRSLDEYYETLIFLRKPA